MIDGSSSVLPPKSTNGWRPVRGAIPWPPPHIARRLPPQALLHDTLLFHVTVVDVGAALVRAAWNEASVLPPRVERTCRFGPPDALRGSGGDWPFHWILAAGDVYTAVWEAGLCLNDAEQPGTSYTERGARAALVATLRFNVPLKLVDLNGLASSKLAIFDDISACDHQWCLGCMIDRVIGDADGRVHERSTRRASTAGTTPSRCRRAPCRCCVGPP